MGDAAPSSQLVLRLLVDQLSEPLWVLSHEENLPVGDLLGEGAIACKAGLDRVLDLSLWMLRDGVVLIED